MTTITQTEKNLMRAFAGESQARNRYTFAASVAKKNNLYVVEATFRFTADQEKEHAEIFWKHLQKFAHDNVTISEAGYPVDVTADVVTLLRNANHNELEECDDAYPSFAETARQEGFADIARSFDMIAKIEGVHGQRFLKLAELIEQGKLFVSDVECQWICLNCGHVLESKSAPEQCPVCDHNKGYFIRLELLPYSNAQ